MTVRCSDLDPAFERALRDVLYDRELPCPYCRYDLRGLTGAICPECGRNVEAHLRLADLSPGRLRRQRRGDAIRFMGRVLGMLILLTPVVAVVLYFLLVR